MLGLRERHLSAAVHAVVGRQLGTSVVSTVVRLPEWPQLGQGGADYMAKAPSGGIHLGELKWCQRGQDKVYEAIWDLVKMALATRSPAIETAHLITGAPAEMWPHASCGDLFDGGTFTPEELCTRRFPRGQRRTAWDYLLEGGYGRHPDAVPANITTTPTCDPVSVAAGSDCWLLRAVAVTIASDHPDVPFNGGWPYGARPSDAREPRPDRHH